MASNTPRLNLYKKDPVADANDTFNIQTMLNDNWDRIDQNVALKSDFDAHSAETMQDGVHGLATTQNITYYVDAVNGNDANDGLTGGTPLKTIQAAINKIPQIVNHLITIVVAAGTYNEDVKIEGFVGKGIITINGGTLLANSINFKVSSIRISNCAVKVDCCGFNITSTITTAVSIYRSICVIIRYSKINGVASSGHGVWVEHCAYVKVSDCEISNKSSAIVNFGSRVYSYNNSGTNNSIGLNVLEGGVIAKLSTQPSGTSAESVSSGGVIR